MVIANTQSAVLPPLAADAQATGLGIIQMLAEYDMTKKAPGTGWFVEHRMHVVALACAASGLNRKYVAMLPDKNGRPSGLRVMGAFAMNELWMHDRLSIAPSALGELAVFAPRSPGAGATPEVRQAVSLSWPGQLYYGLILLDYFRQAMQQLTIPNEPLGPLIALWAYWRASSPENQRTLVATQPDRARCEEAARLVRLLYP